MTDPDPTEDWSVSESAVVESIARSLDAEERAVLATVVDRYEAGRDTAVLTVVESGAPDLTTVDRLLVPDSDLSSATTVEGAWPSWTTDSLAGPVETLLANEQSDTLEIARSGDITRLFVDVVTAPSEIVVFGTGHDVTPVVELGRKLDCRVTVVGFRGGLAAEDRFPEADRVVSTSPAQVRNELDVDADTYAVVMTHNFLDDAIAVGELLERPTPYIGLMGPTDRFDELVEDVESGREPLSGGELDRIYTPVGLDLGGGAPYVIALSVVSEVQAVANDRDPKHLRERKSPIHERVEVDR